MNLSFEEYQENALKTFNRLESTEMDNIHALLGMSTELAEIQDLFKKKIAYKKHFSKEQLEDESGDLLFYYAVFISINKLDINEIMQKNINKLKIRYPEGFNELRAQNPDKEEESKVFSANV